jgi:hypothetical protein
MNYTKEQLVDALCAEWEYLCPDDFDPEVELDASEYRIEMEKLTAEQLIRETGTDEYFTLDEYMGRYG